MDKLDVFRKAAARLFFDMINADGVIEDNEIILLEGLGEHGPVDSSGKFRELPKFSKEANELIRLGGLRKKYKIEQHHIQESIKITTTQAINILRKWQREEEPDLLKYDPETVYLAEEVTTDLKTISACDGNRSIDEAKLLSAISLCLNNRLNHNSRAIPINYREQNLRFSRREIIYLESESNPDINKVIQSNKAYITSMLELYGFDFIYIPDIVNFLKTKAISGLLTPILMFTKPFYYKDEKRASEFAQEIQRITTQSFTKTFSLAANLEEPLPPSLLVKIKTSVIEDLDNEGKVVKTKYSDFIAIPVQGSTLDSIRRLPDNILEFTDQITSIITKTQGQKLYCKGIHKTLIDLIIHKSNEQFVKQIRIYLRGEKIGVEFVGIDGGFVRFSPKEISIYLLVIIFTAYGRGVPKNDLKDPYCKKLSKEFSKIYSCLRDNKLPLYNVFSTIRSNIKNNINSGLANFKDKNNYNLIEENKIVKVILNTDIVSIKFPNSKQDKNDYSLDEFIELLKIDVRDTHSKNK